MNRFLLEELVIDLIFGLLGYDASIVQIIEFLLGLLLSVCSYLLAYDLHVEIDVEVLDFKFLFKAVRLLLVFHDYVLSDLVLDIQEILEPIDCLMLFLIVRERRQLCTLELNLQVASSIINLRLV